MNASIRKMQIFYKFFIEGHFLKFRENVLRFEKDSSKILFEPMITLTYVLMDNFSPYSIVILTLSVKFTKTNLSLK